MKSEPQYIGRLNLKTIQDFIIENTLSEKEAILLNQHDFDALAEEHREIYGVALKEPYFVSNTLITEDNTVPRAHIGKGKNTIGLPTIIESGSALLNHRNETVYRCGWCGNVVDYDGTELEPKMQTYRIELLEKHIREIKLKYVDGYCCSNLEKLKKQN